jgi:hypothetical protein
MFYTVPFVWPSPRVMPGGGTVPMTQLLPLVFVTRSIDPHSRNNQPFMLQNTDSEWLDTGELVVIGPLFPNSTPGSFSITRPCQVKTRDRPIGSLCDEVTPCGMGRVGILNY